MTEPLDWKLAQSVGPDRQLLDEASEADVISAIDIDETGTFVAVGDKGGRIRLLERGAEKRTAAKPATQQLLDYRQLTRFQSHQPEFDCLKSLEIEEKINKVKFCKRATGAQLLLSTNDKTIKLWKVQNQQLRSVCCTNLDGRGVPSSAAAASHTSSGSALTAALSRASASSLASLRVPRVVHGDRVVRAQQRRVYQNAHAYHINSISLSSDCEHYVSADDLRVNLWNLEVNDASFNIVDIKPANMEELTEVITAAEFHPQHAHEFMYSSSKGCIRLADMRANALCDQHAKMFEEQEDPSSKSFFSEIITSISDVKFSPDGRYILARDFMTLKLWDRNMESRPVKTIQIHEHLRPKLCDLYDNDCIFDKFECAFTHDGNHVVTGSYNNMFHIYDRWGRTDAAIEAAKNPVKKKPGALQRTSSKLSVRKRPTDAGPEQLDFARKVLHTVCHPNQNIVAVAALGQLHLYSI